MAEAVTTLVAYWMGGASVPAGALAPPDAAFRSLFAMGVGGASATSGGGIGPSTGSSDAFEGTLHSPGRLMQ